MQDTTAAAAAAAANLTSPTGAEASDSAEGSTYEDRVAAIRRYGLIVTATETSPTRVGKQPRPVWNICGIGSTQLSRWEHVLRGEMELKKWKGQFSAWADPTEQLLELLESHEQLDIAETHQQQAARSTQRAEQLGGRASKHQAAAQTYLARADQLSQRFAGGQPILVGHYSEAGARRDQQKMRASTRKGMEELDYAVHLSDRADAATDHAERKTTYSLRYVGNRLEEARAELRAVERYLSVQANSTVRAIADGREGSCLSISKGKPPKARVQFDDSPSPSPSPARSANWEEVMLSDLEPVISSTRLNDLNLRRQTAEQDIEIWQQRATELGGDRFSPETIKVTDYVLTRFGWREVLKVNRKTLGIKSRYSWMDSLPYHEVLNHLSAEQFAAQQDAEAAGATATDDGSANSTSLSTQPTHRE